jgi:hypothetical protein
MIPILPGEISTSQDLLFNSTMKVFSEGTYDHEDQTDVPARFVRVSARQAATAADRSELAALRQLRWPLTYVMPEEDMIQVEDALGVRWQPVSGTFVITPLYRAVDVMRVR